MENRFSPFVRILGKGKTGSRSLNEQEAFEAMGLILAGEVEDVQLGAFLMLLRVKEESAAELAGFAAACREFIDLPSAADVKPDLDWSSYAGKRRQPHWFLLAALLLAGAGFKVLMHGTRGHTEGRVYSQEILEAIGYSAAGDTESAHGQLKQRQFSFLPLQNFCPPLQRMIDLRPLFGLRSPVHTLCRLINPLQASATLQSVFHPAYMQSHHSAALLLGERRAIVFKGDAGEVEYRPHASVKLLCSSTADPELVTLPRSDQAPEDLRPSAAALADIWHSEDAERHNSYAYHAIIGTAAIGLLAMGEVEDFAGGLQKAKHLWQQRAPQTVVVPAAL